MKKIISLSIISASIFSVPAFVFAAKYKSAVSGKYTTSSYASTHTSTTYKTKH